MGIYDRDYFSTESTFRVSGRSCVVGLIAINVAVWIIQMVFTESVTTHLHCRASDIFGPGFPKIWKLLTANFAHSHDSVRHILGNMFLLFFFGRELEEIYGKRDFLTLYLAAGIIAILTELLVYRASGTDVAVLGASGSIMALVTLYALHFSQRTLLLFFVLPVRMWVLCAAIILMDLIGALAPRAGDQVAHFAHLAGAAVGFLYGRYDLRWTSLRRRFSRRAVSKPRRTSTSTSARTAAPPSSAERDAVSRRIDELLAKIHDRGMGSLTDAEREFLAANSHRYRGTD